MWLFFYRWRYIATRRRDVADRVEEVEQKLKKYVAPNYNPLPFVPVAASGEWLYGFIKGNNNFRYVLDLTSTYSAVNLGHNHPEILALKAKMAEQKNPSKTSRGIVMHAELANFAEAFCQISGMDMIIPKSTGTEAFDTAVKAARLWGYKVKKIPEDKAEIIVCANNFHGRSLGAIDASTDEWYREDFGPFAPPWAFRKIPFGDIDALERAINPHTAAFLPEPIQAEAGIYIPPEGYLTRAKQLCRANNVLLILDEIQTGMGRTGKLFAWQHEGESARPDVMLVGKGIGAGDVKMSLVAASKEILGLLTVGKEGSTFGGDPESCAIALKSLELHSDPVLLARVARIGEQFMTKLRTIRSPHIREVRGRGLLIAVELTPEAGGARRFCEMFLQEGLLCKEIHDNVFRLTPPLTINEHNLLVYAFDRIKKVLMAH